MVVVVVKVVVVIVVVLVVDVFVVMATDVYIYIHRNRNKNKKTVGKLACWLAGLDEPERPQRQNVVVFFFLLCFLHFLLLFLIGLCKLINLIIFRNYLLFSSFLGKC